jgi:adenylate cyclase
MTTTRRLAAVLAADVAGYSRLIGADEGGTLQALRAIRAELIDPTIAAHNGRLVKTTGDGLLVEFGSVVNALRCATEVQAGMAQRNAPTPADKRIEFRIGINMGDIVVEDGDIFGDGVNVAARLEALAEPGGICVSARVQEDATGKLDLAFEDLGEQALKNIARPVRVYRVATSSVSATAQETPALALPDKPSIAVLPFVNMSGDPEQEYFADGMVEEIITPLSRIRWLFVIARNSSFTYKGEAVDLKRVGRELGVRYVLEGSVRKAGGRVRITAQLIDATSGTHLWADRFDGSLEDVFELQDQVATSAARVIELTLQNAEIRRSTIRPTADLSAYDLYLRALECARLWDPASTARALELLNQAIERDPYYGAALALAASCHEMQRRVGSEADRQRVVDLAQRAIRAGAEDPAALAVAAHALASAGEDIDAAIALVDRALEINPSYAAGWYRSGWLRLWAGHCAVAEDHFVRASRLSPYDMPPRALLGIAISQFFRRNFDVMRPERHFSGLCRNFLTGHRTTASSPPAVRKWVGLTRRAMWFGGCVRLRTWCCRTRRTGATPTTESCSCRACAWRWARRNEPRPSTSLHPADINRTYLSKLEKGASYPRVRSSPS